MSVNLSAQSYLDLEKRWTAYRHAREALYLSHTQSPLTKPQKLRFTGLPYYHYDYELRFEVVPVEIPPELLELQLKHGPDTSGAIR